MSAMPSFPASGSTSWYTWATAVHRADDEVLRYFADVRHPDYGATGDGATDDTAAINAAITANSGKTVVVPPGTYMINAVAYTGVTGASGVAQPVGIRMNQADVHLMLAPGATLQAIANDSQDYSIIQATAAGCTISGGKIIGDLQTHTGTDGEWGMGIDVNTGADKMTIRDTYIGEMWGDGICVMGNAADTSIRNVTSWKSRRLGMSVIDSFRTRVDRCNLSYNGTIAVTSPGGGIDVEPDQASARDVVDCIVSDCLISHNVGTGLTTASNTREVTATITGCRAFANGYGTIYGWHENYRVFGASNRTRLINCHSWSPTAGSGFWTYTDTDQITFAGCISDNAPAWGFLVQGTNTKLVGCIATGNGSGSYSGGSQAGCL